MSVVGEANTKMGAALQAVERDFQTVRTGKAMPSILDTVRVMAYGSQMPLNQVATVSVGDATLLVVQPFDPSLIEEIEKAIMSANLGLNPANDGTVVRVPVPPLSQERREEYVRTLHKMAEDGRISVRQARQAANNQIRSQLKEKEFGEDEAHRLLDEVQKLTDEHGRKIDLLLGRKEKEVMEI